MSTGFFALSRFRAIAAALVIASAGAFTFASVADARMGSGGSSGSRGSRTYSAPSATPTAPSVSPFQRSATPRTSPTSPGMMGASRPGFFGGGFGKGLLGGFIGAGVFGLLFGHGLTGGLGGGMSIIGLVLQLGLLYLAFRLIMGFFANRRQQTAGGGNSSFFGGAPDQSGGAGAFGGSPSNQQPQGTPINISPEDYNAFETRLSESQAAYSNGDVGTLRRIATPEMATNFEQELRENERQGVVNKISDVRLLNGDLSEAWTEHGSDYATVAMHFSLIDATLEKASGRVVAGDSGKSQEVTEVWTFQRPAGSGPQGWALSAIQQAG